MKKLIFLGLALIPVMARSDDGLSKIRLVVLKSKSILYSQNRKNRALKEAVCRRDACGMRFWLGNGADFQKACGDYPLRSQYNPSVLYLPVIWYLFGPVREVASNEQMLELLRDYGITEIRWQLKSGFNMIRAC